MTRIAYRDNPTMALCWAGAIQWAVTEPELIESFERETGRRWVFRHRSPIDALVDQACGIESDCIDAFVDWFNAMIWGENPFELHQESEE